MFVVICMAGFFSLYVDVCFKILPADICACRKQLSLEWKTVSLSAEPDVGVILLEPLPSLLAVMWLDGGQWRCKQCSVPCSLSCVHPCGQEEQKKEGAGVGLPGISANASPVSPPSCLEFPFCRIIPAATRRSYKLELSVLSALPNVSRTPFLFNFQCLVVTGSQISLASFWYVWNWSRAGEAMLLEGRVRAYPGLLCGHRVSMSLNPLEYKPLWYGTRNF